MILTWLKTKRAALLAKLDALETAWLVAAERPGRSQGATWRRGRPTVHLLVQGRGWAWETWCRSVPCLPGSVDDPRQELCARCSVLATREARDGT